MMQFLLLIHGDEAAMKQIPKADMQQMLAAYVAYTKTMAEAGVLKAADRLHPSSTATVVRSTGGKTSVVNGPFAEVKEQLGGYYLIDVKDLDAAIAWAARCPGAQFGSIEVRPIWMM